MTRPASTTRTTRPTASSPSSPSSPTRLNLPTITAALDGYVLCADALADRDHATGARVRCGIAALLHAAGVSDLALERLENLGYGGDAVLIWRRYGGILERAYGFQSPAQLTDLMNANDAAVSDADVRSVALHEASARRHQAIVSECAAINAEGRL